MSGAGCGAADDRAALFLSDVLGEPAALTRLLDVHAGSDGPLAAIADVGERRRTLLTGLGSSRSAASVVAARLLVAGRPVVVEPASTDAPLPPASDLLAVAISASGVTPEAVAAIERHRGTSATVAVTNRPDSALARAADVVLPLLAGEERAGVACRTYQATLAVLSLLGGAGVAELRPAADALVRLHASRAAWLGPAVDRLAHAETLHVVAPASRLGSAEQAALMLREGPRLPAVAWEAGDWAHVAIYTVLPGSWVVLLSGTPYDGSIARAAAERGAAVIAVGPAVDGAAVVVPLPDADDPLVRPFVEVSAVELLAAGLWAGATGREAAPTDR
jgi:fructoselysine-6-P-deglycase FrlB-like protein